MRLSSTSTVAFAPFVMISAMLASSNAALAQVSFEGEFCYQPASGLTEQVPVIDGVQQVGECDGSVNKVFRGNDLAGLTGYQLIETAVSLCGLPDGPYARPEGPLDYILGSVAANQTNTIVFGANGNDSPGLIGVTAMNPQVEVDAATNPISVIQTVGERSQVLDQTSNPNDGTQSGSDVGGFEFIHFTPSQGKGNPQVGVLICDPNMWADNVFGLLNFNLSISAQTATVGFAGGPSGAGSQAAATSMCNNANNSGGLEKEVVFVIGGVKVTPSDAANPPNVTFCEDNGLQRYAFNCDVAELPGDLMTASADDDYVRPNSCNPKGETGGIPQANTSTVSGANSTWSFCFGTGTCRSGN